MELLSLQPDHTANVADGFVVLGFDDGVLRLRVEHPGRGLIVIQAGSPVRVMATNNVHAVLCPGWDGTLGYALYGLQVETREPGEAQITLSADPPPNAPLRSSAEELADFKESLRRRPTRFPQDAGSFSEWQSQHRARLASILMNGGLPPRVSLDARDESVENFSTFSLRKVRYRTRDERTNTLLLSTPHHGTRVPVLLALHGHETAWGEADAGAFREGHADDFCAWFAQRGWAVLQPATMNHTLQHKGWTLQGEWTWDAMVALDWAATIPQLDLNRVAVCGLSAGGHLAMNVLALDERVNAGVVGGILSTWNHFRRRLRIPPHCDCGITSQLGPHLEQSDWAALAAPKPVQFQHGRQDAALGPGADESGLDFSFNTGVLPQAEFDAEFSEVRRAYQIAGAPQNLSMHYHAGGHRVDAAAAFDWLNQAHRSR